MTRNKRFSSYSSIVSSESLSIHYDANDTVKIREHWINKNRVQKFNNSFFLATNSVELFGCHHHSLVSNYSVRSEWDLRRDRREIFARRRGIPRKCETGSNCDGATRTSRLKPGSPATPLSLYRMGSNCRRRHCCHCHRRRRRPRLHPLPFILWPGCASGVSIMTEGWLLWMNARSIHGAPRRCVFSESETWSRFRQGWWFDIRKNDKETIAKAPKSRVALSNIGAKEAKGSNAVRPMWCNTSKRGKRIICTLNVDMRRIYLLLFPLMIVKIFSEI